MFNYGKIGRLGRVSRFAQARSVITSAVAATSLSLHGISLAATSNVTSIVTHNTVGIASNSPPVMGYGSGYSIYKSANTYTLKYLGQDDAITSLNTSTLGTYNVSGQGTVVVRRGASGSNNDTIWHAGTGNGSNGSTVTLNGPSVSSFTQAFSANNVLMGADNVFSNMGNGVGNDTNVERIDVLFTGGLSASAQTAFAIFDRGPSNDHDTFKIAAITSLSGGNPASYSSLKTFADGTWGSPVIVPPGTTQENILRKNNTVPGDGFHPSDSTSNPLAVCSFKPTRWPMRAARYMDIPSSLQLRRPHL